MNTPKTPAPVSELQAYLRDMAARPAHHQALSIERQIPPDSKHPSAIEALRFTALVHAAKTELEAERHLNAATAHWKDFMLWDDAVKGEKAKVDARAAARKPRKKDPLRAEIIEVMGPSKRNGDDFKSFMQMWHLGHLGRLTVKSTEDGNKYIITDENGDLGTKIYAWRTLEKMYSEN